MKRMEGRLWKGLPMTVAPRHLAERCKLEFENAKLARRDDASMLRDIRASTEYSD